MESGGEEESADLRGKSNFSSSDMGFHFVSARCIKVNVYASKDMFTLKAKKFFSLHFHLKVFFTLFIRSNDMCHRYFNTRGRFMKLNCIHRICCCC